MTTGLTFECLYDFRRSNRRRYGYKKMDVVRHDFDGEDFPMLLFSNGIQDVLQLILVPVKDAAPILWYPHYVQVQQIPCMTSLIKDFHTYNISLYTAEINSFCSKRENKEFTFIPGLKSEVFPFTFDNMERSRPMKKVITVILALSVVLTMAACGKTNESAPMAVSATASDLRIENKPQKTNKVKNKASVAPEETEVQKKWNGWYYGGVDMRDCTDSWEIANGNTFDAMMRIALDEKGEGTLTIMDPYGDLMKDVYVEIMCMANNNTVFAVSGTAFSDNINADEWLLIDEKGTISVSSSSKKDGANIGYDFQFRKWGDKWKGISYSEDIPKFSVYLSLIEQNYNAEAAYATKLLTDEGNMDKGSARGTAETLEALGVPPIQSVFRTDGEHGFTLRINDQNGKTYYLGYDEMGYLEIVRRDAEDGEILYAAEE